MSGPPVTAWPPKYDVIGVPVSATHYDECLERVMHAARARQSACVSHLAVHGLVEASSDPGFRDQLAQFEVVAPDGMPVRHALDLLHDTHLPDRVYGPELMLRICERAAREGVGVYLYGSSAPVIEALRANLERRFSGLRIVGAEPSVFRPLTAEEDAQLVRRVEDSGAGLVFVGLGCPLQEKFAFAHRGRIRAVMLCVGAAFDFHAGHKPMAPRWMQDRSLEWLFRLTSEPGRLWKRYLTTNSTFVVRLIAQLAARRRGSGDPPAAP
ncbi:MAG: WecB/TagA/CpsF family glycosyltransferase [Myxococcales bacterium]|jgi:exopolysaccharide biosynthesis WecB/TagA/CpsF family protein